MHLLPFISLSFLTIFNLADVFASDTLGKRFSQTPTTAEASCIAAYKARLPTQQTQDLSRPKTMATVRNWAIYGGDGFVPLSDRQLSALDEIIYSFATISYSTSLDAYYVDFTDTYADLKACANVGLVDGTGCSGNNVDCIPIPSEKLCRDSNGNLNLALAP